MLKVICQNLKKRIWHFIYMPSNVANIKSGKVELSELITGLSNESEYYLIYQYGKVGSSTVYAYLKNLGLPTVHCHYLSSKSLEMRERLVMDPSIPRKVIGQRFFSNARYRIYQNFLVHDQEGKKLNIFIALREPEAFLKSVYFQQWTLFSELIRKEYGELSEANFTQFFNEKLTLLNEHLTSDISQEDFESLIISRNLDFGTRYIGHFVYRYMFWFQLELFENFNVSAEDFVPEKGFWSFESENVKGSIIRLEDFDNYLDSSLDKLLGENKVGEIQADNKNVGKNKKNYEFYSHLKQNAVIPNEIINHMKSGFSYDYFYEK